MDLEAVVRAWKGSVNPKEVNEMVKWMKGLLHDEEGAAAAEYVLLLALIAVVIIGAATALGINMKTKLDNVATTIGQ